MSEPYVGEIRLFAFPRTPTGWLPCDGRSVSASQFDALFAVIGTTYGGDSQNFKLPDLRGRVPIGQGQGHNLPPYVLGQLAGEETHSLTNSELPAHSHALVASTAVATDVTPSPSLHLATATAGTLYAPVANAGPYETMAACVAMSGQSVGHNNIMPTVVGNYCISVAGVFPSPG
jgi:microcystin-dependent protein